MTRMLPAADCASRNRLASVVEWSISSPSRPAESKKAVPASSKETPCLVLLLAAFLVSHSNTNYVYTKRERSARSSMIEKGESRNMPSRFRRCSRRGAGEVDNLARIHTVRPLRSRSIRMLTLRRVYERGIVLEKFPRVREFLQSKASGCLRGGAFPFHHLCGELRRSGGIGAVQTD